MYIVYITILMLIIFLIVITSTYIYQVCGKIGKFLLKIDV